MPSKPLKRKVSPPPQTDPQQKIKAPRGEPEPDFYRCTCCGTRYGVQKNNFFALPSPLYKGSNGYMSVCKKCLDSLYDQYIDILHDEYEALKTVAMHFDIYFNDRIFNTVRRLGSDRSPVAELVKYSKMNPYTGRTFDDYIAEEAERERQAAEEAALSLPDPDAFVVTDEIRTKWGSGYSDDEYELLEEHYKTFEGQMTEDDPVQSKLVKDLCDINLQQVKCRKTGNFDSYEKMSKLYQATLKSANLKPATQASDANDVNQCWGVYIRNAEAYVPCEVYKHSGLFDDVDKVKEYFTRFVLRPIKNFFSGMSVMDEEFNVDTDDGGGGK